ncbi:MAG: hypothetical protein GXO26_01865, partial [Crenarchaeota archaeon]|nr:hypothetical protein [Thermoproteota archaeon]
MSISFYRSILSTVLRDRILLSSVDSLEHDLDELARKITHLLSVANLGHIFIDLTAQFSEAPPVLYDESSVVNIIALPIGEFETVIPRCRWVLWYGREIYHGHRTGKDMLLATPYYWTPLYGRFTPKLSSLIVEKYFENIIPRAVGVIRGLELYCPLEYTRDIILATIFSMFYNSLYIPYERNSPEKTWESLREHLKMYEKVSNIPIMFYYLSFNSRAPEFTLTRTMGWDELIYELRKFLGRYVLEGHYPPPYIVLPEG